MAAPYSARRDEQIRSGRERIRQRFPGIGQDNAEELATLVLDAADEIPYPEAVWASSVVIAARDYADAWYRARGEDHPDVAIARRRMHEALRQAPVAVG